MTRGGAGIAAAALLAPVVACDRGDGGAAAGDAGADAAGAPVLYALDPGLPEAALLGERRGLRVARATVHLHTVHSHDACDGEPRGEDGTGNEACLADLRAGLCRTRQDVAFTTDHEETAARAEFLELLLLREGDEPVAGEDGRAVASRIDCGDGFRVLLVPGGEFAVMPVGLSRHLAGTAKEREAAYQEPSPARVEELRAAGAVVLQAHTESKPLSDLRALGLDGIEVYNTHANLDPEIRRDHLGLEPLGYLEDTAPFLAAGGPSPDLMWLGFFAENGNALGKWDALLAQGRMTGVTGNDAHQNVFPAPLADGERGDSYRRMLRWHSNHLLVPAGAPLDPPAAKDALRAGRAYLAFEALGTPEGFDFHAETPGGGAVELGGTAPAGSTLVLTLPRVRGWDGAPPLGARVIRAGADAPVIDREGAPGDTLRVPATEPGAYRAEVRLVPHHLRPWLGPDAERYLHPYVWIYANAIRVEDQD